MAQRATSLYRLVEYSGDWVIYFVEVVGWAALEYAVAARRTDESSPQSIIDNQQLSRSILVILLAKKCESPTHRSTPKGQAMKKVFDATGPFEAERAAEEWRKERDIAVGSMERNQPRGLAFGPYVISKWSNLRPHERNSLDGTMTGDMRHGPVTIELVGNEEDYPIVEYEDWERDAANGGSYEVG